MEYRVNGRSELHMLIVGRNELILAVSGVLGVELQDFGIIWIR